MITEDNSSHIALVFLLITPNLVGYICVELRIHHQIVISNVCVIQVKEFINVLVSFARQL
jgi:hypothetical protein